MLYSQKGGRAGLWTQEIDYTASVLTHLFTLMVNNKTFNFLGARDTGVNKKK